MTARRRAWDPLEDVCLLAGPWLAGLIALAALAATAAVAGCDSARDPGAVAGGAPVSAPEAATAPPSVEHRAVVTVRAPEDDRAIRFRPWAVYLEVGETDIAAYQVEIVVRSGDATVVGVEGGADPGFDRPPYYDPEALAGGRIVLAAFDTRTALARGRHRVATLHMQESGPAPTYELRLIAAAAPDGSTAVAGVDLAGAGGENRWTERRNAPR